MAVPGAAAVSVLGREPDSPPRLLVSAGRRLVLLAARMTGAHVTELGADCAPRLPPLAETERSAGGRRAAGADTAVMEARAETGEEAR